MRVTLFLLLLVLPRMILACSCQVSRSICQEVADSNLVFIGTVDSVRSGLGTNARFKVLTLFQRKEDHDDSDSSNKKKSPLPKLDYVEVSSEAGDCGIVFQKGETYLVYANDDEQTGRMETNLCYRTTRLSEAGEDLPYLFFFQNAGANALRLEGFVTSEIAQLLPDPFHYSTRIKSPVPDVTVELKSGQTTRYIQPDLYGRFIFDGLAEGDYQVSAFSKAYPLRMEKLSGPKRVHLSKEECGLTTLFVVSHGPQ